MAVSEAAKSRIHRALRPADPGRTLLLVPEGDEAAETFVFSEGDCAAIPDTVHGLRVEQVGPVGDRLRWELACDEGRFEVQGRGVEILSSRPQLFDDLLAPYALRRRDRRVVAWLLGLLRLRGGAWLLRAWHSRRR